MNPCRIGIANSVAKQENYDWEVTLRFARRNDISLVQLYLPPLSQFPRALSQVRTHHPQRLRLIWHLPPVHSKPQLIDYLKPLKSIPSDQIIIQHQRILTPELAATIAQYGYTPGLENDDPQGDPDSFLYYVQAIRETCGQAPAVVFDVSRFFVQLYPRFSREQIIRSALDLFLYCREAALPLILHVIDHKTLQGGRDQWVPFSEGDLPYRVLFDFIRKNQIPLTACIFEYEDFETTTRSIRRLKSFLAETI